MNGLRHWVLVAGALVLCVGSLARCESSSSDVDVAGTEDVLPAADTVQVVAGVQATINGTLVTFDQTVLGSVYVDQTGTVGETTIQAVTLKPAGFLVGGTIDLRIDTPVSGTFPCSFKYTGAIKDTDTPYDKFNASGAGSCTANVTITGTTGGSISGTFEASGTGFTVTGGTFNSAITVWNQQPASN